MLGYLKKNNYPNRKRPSTQRYKRLNSDGSQNQVLFINDFIKNNNNDIRQSIQEQMKQNYQKYNPYLEKKNNNIIHNNKKNQRDLSAVANPIMSKLFNKNNNNRIKTNENSNNISADVPRNKLLENKSNPKYKKVNYVEAYKKNFNYDNGQNLKLQGNKNYVEQNKFPNQRIDISSDQIRNNDKFDNRKNNFNQTNLNYNIRKSNIENVNNSTRYGFHKNRSNINDNNNYNHLRNSINPNNINNNNNIKSSLVNNSINKNNIVHSSKGDGYNFNNNHNNNYNYNRVNINNYNNNQNMNYHNPPFNNNKNMHYYNNYNNNINYNEQPNYKNNNNYINKSVTPNPINTNNQKKSNNIPYNNNQYHRNNQQYNSKNNQYINQYNINNNNHNQNNNIIKSNQYVNKQYNNNINQYNNNNNYNNNNQLNNMKNNNNNQYNINNKYNSNNQYNNQSSLINTPSIPGVSHTPSNNSKSYPNASLPLPSPKLFASYSYSEDPNKKNREKMEDFHTIIPSLTTNPSSSYFAIFDGHSGEAPAKYCKENLHKILLKNLSITKFNIEKSLMNSFQEIDNEISKKNFPNDSGTTASVILIYERYNSTIKKSERYISCANVGDSKCYLIKRNSIMKISKDHNCNDKEEVERVKKNGGMVFNNRVFGSLMLTRSIGDREMKNYGVCALPSVNSFKLSNDDFFVVIASDGVWDVVNEKMLFDVFKGNFNGEEFSKKIIEISLNEDSMDNVSCVVVKL